MAKDYIGYEALTERALRSVVREALKSAATRGLVANHHFYITFKTHHAGVEMPDFLREQYPDEITIVLQNQYSGLKVEANSFDVTLSFHKIPANLHVPFAALTAFVDPGVQFGLQFKGAANKGATSAGSMAGAPSVLPAKAPKTAEAGGKAQAAAADNQVVSLDKFRKK